MEQLNKEILLEFESIVKYPIIDYFTRIDSFFRKDQQSIISYYSGNIASLDSIAFNNLKSLIDETQNLFSVFSLNKNILNNYKWWVLIAQIEQVDTALLLIDNSSKWLRSTISKGNFNPNPEVDIPFNQGQTLESLERDILGSDDWQNSWANLALKNDLREEDYTSEAGFLIKANYDYVLNSFRINSIVDNPIGEKVLGIDIDKKIQYVTIDGEDDLAILSPKETFKQNVTILINLRKGDNPEFYDQGINPRLIVGSNVNSITYPILFRQLSSLFRDDDTIKSFTIVSINRQSDAVFLQFEVESRLEDVENISLKA